MQILLIFIFSLLLLGSITILERRVFWLNRAANAYVENIKNEMLIKKVYAYTLAYLNKQKHLLEEFPINSKMKIPISSSIISNKKIKLFYTKKSNKEYSIEIKIYKNSGLLKLEKYLIRL